MGTKDKPGAFDCYNDAANDEPIFTLRGSDPAAGLAILIWAEIKERMRADGHSKISDAKLEEARDVAGAMNRYVLARGGNTKHARVALETLTKRTQAQYDRIAATLPRTVSE